MYNYSKAKQLFMRLTDAENDNEVWIDTCEIILLKPWLEEDGTITTCITFKTNLEVKVKESIKDILNAMKGTKE